MAEKKYYRVCTRLNDKGVLIPEGSDLESYKKGEAYVSAYKYNEEHKKVFDKNGTVAGITDVEGDIIYFDFDHDDIEVARKDAIEVSNRLESYGIGKDQYKIYFSGRKGFNFSIHTTETFTPEEAKSLAIKLAGDLPSFDSSIYNSNRIIRLEGSLHKKTGLRKTPISFDELQTLKIADIKALATTSYAYDKPVKVSPTEAFIKLTEPITERKKGDELTLDSGVDYLSNPFRFPPRVLAISQGFFPAGERSNALMILATNLKNKGLTDRQCHHQLRAAADAQAERYGSDSFDKKEIWNNIVQQIYKPTWRGGQYTEDNYPVKLQQYFEELGVPVKEFKEVANSVMKLDEGFDDFIQYAASIHKNTLETGIKELDDALKIRKGHLIGLIAPPSVGKTSFALTLLNNTSKKGTKSFFGCYDMYQHNVTAKLIQRHTGSDEETIYNSFVHKDQNQIEEYRKVLKDNYNNVSFCFKAGQTIDQLKKAIEMEESKSGEDVELVVIDYLELINTDKSDPTISSAEAIQGLREIANDGKVVLCLLQPNKLSSKINQPMTSYNAAKGSSAIAQACTAIMGCWREGMSPDTPENDRFFSINILKNRNGPLASLDFSWDGKTQTISTLSATEKFNLSVLRDTKEDSEDDY